MDVPDRNSHLSSFGQCYSSNGSGLIAVSSGGRGRRVEPERFLYDHVQVGYLLSHVIG